MMGVFIFIEWLASVNEMVCGLVWTQAIMERRFDKKYHRLFLVLIAGLIAVGIVLLNLVELKTNYITSFYAYFSLMLGSCILYKGKAIEMLMITIGYSAILTNTSAFVVRATTWLGIPLEWVSTFGVKRVGIILIGQCFLAGITGIAYVVIKRIRSNIPFLTISIVCVCMGSLGFFNLFFCSGDIVGIKLSTIQIALGIILSFAMMILYLWLQMQKENKERAYTIQQNRILEKNYATAKESYETNAKLYHDMNNHFLLLQSYLKENKVEEAGAYLEKLSKERTKHIYERYTGIEAIDYILS